MSTYTPKTGLNLQFEEESDDAPPPLSLGDKIRKLKIDDTPISRWEFIKKKTFIIGLCCLFFVHGMLHLNKTFCTSGQGYYACGMSSDQYKDYIKALDKSYRGDAIYSTHITFFNELPDWTINLVYVAYFIMLLLWLNHKMSLGKKSLVITWVAFFFCVLSAKSQNLLQHLTRIESLTKFNSTADVNVSLKKDGWAFITNKHQPGIDVDLVEWGKPNKLNVWHSEQVTIMIRSHKIVASGYSTANRTFADKTIKEIKGMGYILIDEVKSKEEDIFIFSNKSKNIYLASSIKALKREGMEFLVYAYTFYNAKYFPHFEKIYK